MWNRGPAPMRPYETDFPTDGGATFMEVGNGIMGDMCGTYVRIQVRWICLSWNCPKELVLQEKSNVQKDGKSKHCG